MNDSVNTFSVQIAAPADAEAPAWNLIMPAGTFTARDGGRGPFVAGTRADMQKVVDRSLAYAAGTEMMVDFDHQAAFAANPKVGGRAEAAGWVKALEVRDDGIYAQIDWTTEASRKIKAKKYRYLSPYFFSNKTTGAVGLIVNVALTNTPAMDLTAIAASSFFSDPEEPSMNAIAKALGLADNASPEAILAAISGNHARIAAAAGLKADATFEAIVASVSGAVVSLGKIAVAAGLKAEAGADDVLTAMTANAGQMVPAATFNTLNDQFKALTARVDERDVDELVGNAMAAGKVAPANEKWARNYCASDRAGFEGFVAAAPVLTKVQLGDATPRPGGELNANALAAQARTYQDEQAALGITVSISDAVTHVEAATKAKK